MRSPGTTSSTRSTSRNRIAVRQVLQDFVDVHRAQVLLQLCDVAIPAREFFPPWHPDGAGGRHSSASRVRLERHGAGIGAGLVMDFVTSVAAEMFTSSAMVRCPRMMAPPPTVQRRRCGRCRRCRRSRPSPCGRRCARCGDLDLVVELDAVLDHRVVEGTAVDGGVGADLDIVADDDAADLRNLGPAASATRGQCRSRRRRSPRRRG
jgi:hypothetical protein